MLRIRGDGILAEFGIECALAIQKTMAKRNTNVDPVRVNQRPPTTRNHVGSQATG